MRKITKKMGERKMRKKLLSFVLCLAMTFSVNTSLFAATVKNPTQEVAQAEEQQKEVDFVGQMSTGLESLEAIELSPEEYAAIKQAQEEQEEQENVCAAKNYDWEKYSGQYCYNHMTDCQKEFYEKLKEVCCEVATTTKTVTAESGYYVLDFVSYAGMSLDEAEAMTTIFVYQNPQYYFVSNKTACYQAKEEISLCIYPEFADGNERQKVSTQFMNKINACETQIASKGSEYERAKEAHDLVCKNVRYVSGTYDQSAYSAVIEGQTVCAGYTKMYGILCNGAGIESIGVTNRDHGWNKVKVDNDWYNVDTTWDDQNSIIYDYFLVSDENVNKLGQHEEEYKKYKVYPESPFDYTNLSKIPLTGVSLSERNLTMKRGEQKTLSVVYQPANATERPGEIWTSSNPQAVSVDNKGVITAVTPDSSAVITVQVGVFSSTCNVMVEAEDYTVTFHANGHGNAPEIQKVPYGGKVTNPGNISTTGYTFGGWYKEAACNHAWNFENDVVTGNVTLYAKWTKVPNPSENTNGNNTGTKVASYQGYDFYHDGNGKICCYDGNGDLVKNEFKCDGTYTYYFQNDGTAMTDRLTYHPDKKHVIYLDKNGHEVFNNFAHITKSISGDTVDDLCFFDVYGHMYVDVVTYDQAGKNLYYANQYGVMERKGWFNFSDEQGGGIGYANPDGTLLTNQFSKDEYGRVVYFQANGRLAKGLMTDGVTYYQMDEIDGHCIGQFPVN